MSWVTCLFRTHWHHGSTNVAQSIIKQTIAWHRFCLVYIDIHICRFNYLCRPHEAAKSLRLFSSRRFLWSGFLRFIRNNQVAQNKYLSRSKRLNPCFGLSWFLWLIGWTLPIEVSKWHCNTFIWGYPYKGVTNSSASSLTTGNGRTYPRIWAPHSGEKCREC